jgi:hypothetical protein
MVRTVLGGLIGGLVSVGLPALTGCSAGGGEATSSASQAEQETPLYVALGDSVAFGEDGYIPWTDPSRTSAAQFVGYPEIAGFDPVLEGVTNLACPGETTGSFLSATAPDNGCRQYKSLHPQGLHSNYPGETQIQAALTFLATHPGTKLVTLNLGGNDLLLVEYGCATAANPIACAQAALPGAIYQAAVNVGTIAYAIRQAGYAGQIVFLTQYSTNYNDPLQGAAIPPLNQALGSAAAQFGATVADGYGAFQTLSQNFGGDPCKAGLLIPSPARDGTCDKHPSLYGQGVLAGTILIGVK